METPEGETTLEWLRENRVLNLDVNSFMTRGTLVFLSLKQRISDMELTIVRMGKKLERIDKQLIHIGTLLRDIKRTIA